MKKIRVLLIEKSAIVSTGFANILHSDSGFECVGSLDSCERLAENVVAMKPDVIVMNPQLVDYSKRQSFRSMIQNVAAVPVVAMQYAYFEPALLRNFDAVIEIGDDAAKIEGKLAEVVQRADLRTSGAEVYELSDREREVLIELAKGLTNKEIAQILHISVHTVMTHRKNIIRKTGIKSVAGLAVYAMLNNLIE